MQLDCEIANHEAGRNAILVGRVSQIYAVTERFLITEEQVWHLADPLKTGERLLEAEPEVLGHGTESAARND